ncbi:MAG: polysaccharide deacetylase family protein [Betaproteobacteria bacterium]
MSAWSRLDRELDQWREQGKRATFWLRDDDACRNTEALRRLLAIADAHQAPLALAVIPAQLDASLVSALAPHDGVSVVQHGYAHRNHAPAGERSGELGAHRPPSDVLAELADGRDRLAGAFGTCFEPILVPPWNRIDAGVVARLSGAGYCGLSTFGPRASLFAAPGLRQCNAHVDLVAWRKDRAFIGADAATDRCVAHLRARREAAVDAAEPTGILTHHLDLGADAWQFLDMLLQRTRGHAAAAWLDVTAAFAAHDGADTVTAVTCGRSA